MARFVILLLFAFHVEAGPLIISKPGSNVSINCPCLKSEGCHGSFMRWARLDTNGTVGVIDTDCQKQPCRFSSEVKSDSEIQLTVVLVQKNDSGRYYCGDKLSSQIDFKAGDALLHVGEEEVWTNNSKVVMLYEWFNDSLEDQRIRPRRCAELRCLVSGLGAPLTDILWRSSGGKSRTGRILESIKTNNGFQVMSQLQIPILVSYQFCHNNLNNEDNEQARDNDYNFHNALQHEESDKDLGDEEWWCEVHAGGNKVYKSNTSPLHKKNKEESEPCPAQLHSFITFSTVCVILLLILTCHWVSYLSKDQTDSTHQGASLLSTYQVDSYTTVKYMLEDSSGRRQRGSEPGGEKDSLVSTTVIFSSWRESHFEQ